MKDIRQIHRDAILLIKQAEAALVEGDSPRYINLAMQALGKEREAAIELINDLNAEPTRSVLFRSAAIIAFNIGDFSESQRLARLALAGNPFIELKEELQRLLEEAENAIEKKAARAREEDSL